MSVRYGNALFCHNISINGAKAVFFALGLSSWRYIEYGFVLDSLRDAISQTTLRKKFVLDVGCGYSILPSFLKKMGFQVCAAEISKMALKFQHDKGVQVVQASAEKMPFRQKSWDAVISISVIEHIPGDGDIAAVAELSKQLKDKGSLIISLPFGEKSGIENDSLCGIPFIFRQVLRIIGTKRFILKLFQAFRIERGEGVLERVYNSKEINTRIIKSSQSVVKKELYVSENKWSQLIYKIIPMTLFSWVEYQLARFMKTEKEFHQGLILYENAIFLEFESS